MDNDIAAGDEGGTMVNNFDVLKEMGNRNLDIKAAPLSNISSARKVKAGTQITIGFGGDIVADIERGKFNGALILADRKEFEQVAEEMEHRGGSTDDLRPLEEYHEDYGTVLWWHVPIQEPPYVGGGPGGGDRNASGEPTTCAELLESGWLTHWSVIPQPRIPKR
jgi:hypothetical protein